MESKGTAKQEKLEGYKQAALGSLIGTLPERALIDTAADPMAPAWWRAMVDAEIARRRALEE